MDCIKIRQLEIFAYHGCNEDEKINGQKFYVDANLYTDVRTPGLSDDLEDTVNYAKACKFINKFMTENRFDLIEAVAEQTTRGLLKEFPKIKAIDFTINKPNAPIKLPFGNVAVSISRKWNKAYLSIGSNIGDKEDTLIRQLIVFMMMKIAEFWQYLNLLKLNLMDLWNRTIFKWLR